MNRTEISRRQFLGLAAGLAGLAAGCAPAATPVPGGQPGEAGRPRSGGTLTFGLSSDPPNLDPHVSTGTAAMNVKMQVYNGLVRYWRKGEIVPDLAESWTTPDPTTYIFRLRRGVKFHDGSDFTARDVKASLERILDPKVGATRRADLRDIKEVVVEDDYTVRLSLARPNAALLAYLARPECAILSAKFLEAGGDPNTRMVGTGPFRFVSREPGVRIVLEKNPDYFRRGLPYLDRVVFVAYPDENTRVTAIRAGDVDLIEYVPWKDTAALQREPHIQVFSGFGPFMCLIFNVRQKPFDDPRVRRAFGYAVNRQSILDVVFFGRGAPITGGLVPKEHWAYSPDLEGTYTYDPERAKALLKEAGYGDGLRVRLLSTSQYGMHQGTAEVVQNDLRKIGVQVDLELYDWPTTVEKHNKGEYQFRVHGLAPEVNDPDFLTQFFRTGSPYTTSNGFSDPEVDRLLDEGRSTLDQQQRKAIYHQLEKRLLELAPWVYLTWREQSEAALKKVRGYEHLPGGLAFVSAITLEEVWLEA